MAAGRGAGSERAVAVVLFTDLVGSTELRARVGEEAAEELRRKHDRLLTQAVEANSGRVVKGLGDGIMATFAGASDAVAAAVAIQQAVDRLNRSAQAVAAIEVRVGISAGDVSFEDDDVHGTPVIEASRLCGAAGGGEILASEMVRWLARSSAAGAFTPVGDLELKGLPDAVPAVRVGWEPLAASDIPMPNLLTDVGRIFVGRDAELGRLEQLWKEAAAGERRVAFVAGEPGVGKTRLAAELAHRVHDEGGTVLAGRCDEGLGVPYQPFVEALRHFIDHAPPEDLKKRLGRYGGELSRLLPELGERVPRLPAPLRSDPETERYRLFDAVAAWLGATAAEGPLLLVLDDLQWAAKPTLLLLRHVVRSADSKRLLVLGTYRDTELGHEHPLVEALADLRREVGVERISLTGLDSSGVAAMMEQAAGHAMGDDALALARAIHDETEGNPFFVREVLRHLAETGAIEQSEGHWGSRLDVSEFGIPESVREVIGRRLSRLSQEANQVLRTAAVVGPGFDVSVVQTVGTFGQETLFSCLEEAAEARLIIETRDPGCYRFGHALVRDTLYGTLSAARRVALHHQVAEAIEAVHATDLDDYLPALAHHWARASMPAADTTRAVEYATRAGHRALKQLAHDEAVDFYRQALDLLAAAKTPDEDPRQLDLLIFLGVAQQRAGDLAYRQTLLDAADLARRRDDADALVRAALANQRGFWRNLSTVDTEWVEVLETALTAFGDGDDPLRAQLLAHLGAELAMGPDRARYLSAADGAIAMARRLGDPRTLADTLARRYGSDWDPLALGKRLTDTEEMLRLAETLGDPVRLAWSHYCRFVPALDAGLIDEAEQSLQTLETLADELPHPSLRWVAPLCRANRLLLAGRLDDAESAAARALETGQAAGQGDAHFMYGAQRFHIRYEQGRLAELLDRFTEVSDLPGARSSYALACCATGRHAEARHVLATLAAELSGDDRDISPVLDFASRPYAAVACHQLGDRSIAAQLRKLPAPPPTQLIATPPVCVGSVSHYLALLDATVEDWLGAENNFSIASTIYVQIGAPTWLARTRLEWASVLLSRRQPGDTERARELLGQALATARELGLGGVERRAVQLLEDGP